MLAAGSDSLHSYKNILSEILRQQQVHPLRQKSCKQAEVKVEANNALVLRCDSWEAKRNLFGMFVEQRQNQ